MDEITATLQKLSLLQMVLAWAFVACYALALGGMLGPTGSRRAAAAALLAAALFSALSDNWVHGALLVLFAVAGMGLFVASAWLLARSATWFLQRHADRPGTATVPRKADASRPMGGMLRSLWRSEA